MYEVILVRGISGSGKTKFGRMLLNIGAPRSKCFFAADDYFVEQDGNYNFDARKLPAAHSWCQEQTENSMRNRLASTLVVHNTFTQRWEMEPYLRMAEEHGYMVTVVSLYDGGCTDEELATRNQHGVDALGISRMRERWEHDWKSADPRPPWEREGM